MSDEKFIKTVVTYEILSEGPLPDSFSLADLHEMTDTGDCVGRFGETVMTELIPKQMAHELLEFGSEPGFFMLDEEGNRVDEDEEEI